MSCCHGNPRVEDGLFREVSPERKSQPRHSLTAPMRAPEPLLRRLKPRDLKRGRSGDGPEPGATSGFSVQMDELWHHFPAGNCSAKKPILLLDLSGGLCFGYLFKLTRAVTQNSLSIMTF